MSTVDLNESDYSEGLRSMWSQWKRKYIYIYLHDFSFFSLLKSIIQDKDQVEITAFIGISFNASGVYILHNQRNEREFCTV